MLLRERGIELSVEHNSEQGAFTEQHSTVESFRGGKNRQRRVPGSDLKMPRDSARRFTARNCSSQGVCSVFSHGTSPHESEASGTVFGQKNGIQHRQMAVGREGNTPHPPPVRCDRRVSVGRRVPEAVMNELLRA